VVGAGIARKNGDNARADHYLQIADSWRSNLGHWTVTTNGPLSSQPYFLRITADGRFAINYGPRCVPPGAASASAARRL